MNLNFKEQSKKQRVLKSFTLELVPTTRTQQIINENDFIKRDEELNSLALKIRPVIDDVIKFIISEGLASFTYDYTALYNAFVADSKSAAYEKEKKKLSNAIIKALSSLNLPYTDKKKIKKSLCVTKISSADFTNNFLPDWINKNYIADDNYEILDAICKLYGCNSLISNFTKKRVNIITQSVPNRVIENFEIYAKNIKAITDFVSSPCSNEFKKSYPNINEYTCVDFYNNCLTPEGIAAYNKMVRGDFNESGIKVKGFNISINEEKQKNKDNKFKKIKTLNKQILFDKVVYFTYDKLEDDGEVLDVLTSLKENMSEDALMDIYKFMKNANTDEIKINGNKLYRLFGSLYENFDDIMQTVRDYEKNCLEEKLKVEKKKAEIRKNLENIANYVSHKVYVVSELEKIIGKPFYSNILTRLLEKRINIIENEKGLNKVFLANKALYNYRETVKSYTDALCEFRNVLNFFVCEEGDAEFYEEYNELVSKVKACIKGENLLRNYLTRSHKDAAPRKRVCFGNSPLYASSWWNEFGDRRLGNNIGAILRRKEDGIYRYYFTVKNPLAKTVKFEPAVTDDVYEVFSDKNIRGQQASRGLPKNSLAINEIKNAFEKNTFDECVLISEKFLTPVKCTREIYEIANNKLATNEAVKSNIITEEEKLNNMYKLIDYYKAFMKSHKDYAIMDLKLKDTKEYTSLNEFFNEVDAQGAKFTWFNVDAEDINKMEEEGAILLFAIEQKSLYSDNPKGYGKVFLSIFNDKNFEKVENYLGSRFSIFYRKAYLDARVTHPKGSIAVNKKDVNGDSIPRDIYCELNSYYNGKIHKELLSDTAKLYVNNNLVKCHPFNQDRIKDARYTRDQYVISMSYEKNIDVANTMSVLDFNKYLFPDINECNVLTIIRGVKDLLYYTVSDKDGNIIEEKSLNVIDGIDYGKRLDELSKERNNSKSDSWIYDKEVANYKKAYIDFAITEITKKALEYNAYIVVDKLSKKFKDKMVCIDNQIFKVFEDRLVSRLSDLSIGEDKYVQLAKVPEAGEIVPSLQNGILFFIPVMNIKKMDPATGFISLFNTNNISRLSEKTDFLSKFDSIKYDKNYEGYVCEFDYKNFKTRYEAEKTKWTLLAAGPRKVLDKRYHKYVTIDNISDEAHIAAVNAGITDSDNIVDFIKEGKLNGKVIDAFYNLINFILNKVTYIDDNNKTLYVSPVINGSRYTEDINHVASVNFIRKFRHRIENINEDFDTPEKYMSSWLNYMQK